MRTLLLASLLGCIPEHRYDTDGDEYRDERWAGPDCDDTDPEVHPDAPEYCDGKDNDCDGYVDEDSPYSTVWYRDEDADGYGDDFTTIHTCVRPEGYVAVLGDCDDTNFYINPAIPEVWYNGLDEDCDGGSDYDQDGDGYWAYLEELTGQAAELATDCNDQDALVHPEAQEVWYDGIDQNCDAHSDYDQDFDGHDDILAGGDDCVDTDPTISPSLPEVYYDGVDANCDGLDDFDLDGDGVASLEHGQGLDCNDQNALVLPGAQEIWYDGVDQDCSGGSDFDQDGDGHLAPAGGGSDCDDTRADAYPGALERWYDGVDQNCDGLSDFDQDGDGYLAAAHGGTDCDDSRADTWPGAPELWYDGIDQDCSGGNDFDQDLDGFMAAEHGGVDCNDTQGAVFPGAPDPWYDGIDQDCAGNDDFDQDQDGYGSSFFGFTDCNDLEPAVRPSAVEVWYDGVDQNCDGQNDFDQDGDGALSRTETALGTDCDDTDPTVLPGAVEVWYDGVDQDCDDHNDFDQDFDGHASLAESVGLDCDDQDPAVSPSAPEIWYDGIDQNCDAWNDYDSDFDGQVSADHGGPDCNDLDSQFGAGFAEVWYDGQDQNCDGLSDFDQDLDGYDTLAFGQGTDCDDTDPAVHISAVEIWYDGVDQDCDGASDFDQDADGYDLLSAGGLDCDDTSSAIHPNAPEQWYDGVDQNCDFHNDYDSDFDGFGSAAFPGGLDCDDDNFSMRPGASEIWYDGVDQNCDGLSDYDSDLDGDDALAHGGGDCNDASASQSSLIAEVWYNGVDNDCSTGSDFDQDGDGSPIQPDLVLPGAPVDCDDQDPSASPFLAETWYNGVDNDCSGNWSDYDQDDDGFEAEQNGHTATGLADCQDLDPLIPATPEIAADGIDQNCDGADWTFVEVATTRGATCAMDDRGHVYCQGETSDFAPYDWEDQVYDQIVAGAEAFFMQKTDGSWDCFGGTECGRLNGSVAYEKIVSVLNRTCFLESGNQLSCSPALAGVPATADDVAVGNTAIIVRTNGTDIDVYRPPGTNGGNVYSGTVGSSDVVLDGDGAGVCVFETGQVPTCWAGHNTATAPPLGTAAPIGAAVGVGKTGPVWVSGADRDHEERVHARYDHEWDFSTVGSFDVSQTHWCAVEDATGAVLCSHRSPHPEDFTAPWLPIQVKGAQDGFCWESADEELRCFGEQALPGGVLEGDWVDWAVSAATVCGIVAGGTVNCANPNEVDYSDPSLIPLPRNYVSNWSGDSFVQASPPATASWDKIGGSYFGFCALDTTVSATGAITSQQRCWGTNETWQRGLGLGSISPLYYGSSRQNTSWTTVVDGGFSPILVNTSPVVSASNTAAVAWTARHSSNTPVAVPEIQTGGAAGIDHVCGLDDGAVVCGDLSTGVSYLSSSGFLHAATTTATYAAVVTTSNMVCAVREVTAEAGQDGRVECVGGVQGSILLDGANAPRAIAASSTSVCAYDDQGAICAGSHLVQTPVF